MFLVCNYIISLWEFDIEGERALLYLWWGGRQGRVETPRRANAGIGYVNLMAYEASIQNDKLY